MKNKISPAFNEILIEVEKFEKTKNGIIIPDDKMVKERAVVLAVGKGVKNYKVGDVILYKSWAVDIVEISEDESYTFIEEEKVLGKIE